MNLKVTAPRRCSFEANATKVEEVRKGKGPRYQRRSSFVSLSALPHRWGSERRRGARILTRESLYDYDQ
eukprot:scaffold10451_cov125-Skeletonema_menzelii.AAC.1